MIDARRRRWMLGLCSACTAVAGAGCAAIPAAGALMPRELAPGVFMLAGSGGLADADNLGRIGNLGFIVGERGVIAVDTGTSRAHGEAVLAAIAQVTALPVRVALVTHTKPEFLFGGEAFRSRGIPIRMHRRTAGLMASRCETCLKNLRLEVGEEAMAGTAMYKADETFDSTHELDLIGRPVQVLTFGHASGPGDIAVLDPRSGVLFAGGLVDAQRVPDIQDSDMPGWNAALDTLRALRPRTVVPGHGAAGGAEVIERTQAYLKRLDARVRDLAQSGVSLLGVAEGSELPEYAAWDQYEVIHRRNASIAFLRVERELLFK